MADDDVRRGRCRLDALAREQGVRPRVEVRETRQKAALERAVDHVQRLPVDPEAGDTGSERLGEDRGTDGAGRDVRGQTAQRREPALQLAQRARQALLDAGRDLGGGEHVLEIGRVDERQLARRLEPAPGAARPGLLDHRVDVRQDPPGEGPPDILRGAPEHALRVEEAALADEARAPAGRGHQVLVDVAEEGRQEPRQGTGHRLAQAGEGGPAGLLGHPWSFAPPGYGAAVAGRTGVAAQGREDLGVGPDEGDPDALPDDPGNGPAHPVGPGGALSDQVELDGEALVPGQRPVRREETRGVLRGQGEEQPPLAKVAHRAGAGCVSAQVHPCAQVDRNAGVCALVQVGPPTPLWQDSPAGVWQSPIAAGTERAFKLRTLRDFLAGPLRQSRPREAAWAERRYPCAPDPTREQPARAP